MTDSGDSLGVGEVLALMLDAYEVTHVFHVPAVLRNTMVEIERRTGIKRVRPHGEKPAAYMADGYARIARRPGVCMAQVVGALNLGAGLRDAHLAHAPVIAFTGGRDPLTKFRNVYQEVDDMPAFEPVTKWNATVDHPDRVADMVRQAFRVAVADTPGPVHLQFRGNEAQIDAETTHTPPDIDPGGAAVPPHRPVPSDPAPLQQAVRLLAEADRPVIVAGGGVRWSQAGAELVALAERLQVPVATTLNGKDSIPGRHRLAVGVVGTYSRGSANRVVAAADLVCFVGTSTGSMATHFWQAPPVGVATIQIDINPAELGRNYLPSVAVCGDAKAVLTLMLSQCEGAGAPGGGASRGGEDRAEWLARAGREVARWYDDHADEMNSDAVPIRPERVCAELSANLGGDAIVVVDTGHAGMWMGGMFDVTGSQSYLRSAGHLGWAFPAAIGAKCAAPDRPVVCFTGDSGFWYHIAEIETAVRWGINVVVVVNNNASGNQSKRGFDRVYGGVQTERGASELWKFTMVDFAAITNQIGGLGLRVEHPRQFVPALHQALEASRPTVIDVVTDIDALAPLAVTA